MIYQQLGELSSLVLHVGVFGAVMSMLTSRIQAQHLRKRMKARIRLGGKLSLAFEGCRCRLIALKSTGNGTGVSGGGSG